MLQRLDPDWLDAQYNNRALVPDHAEHFARWAAASAAARQGSPGAALDLRYGPAPKQTLDVFPAVGPAPGPVLFFVHGGYWRSLDKSDHSFVAPAFNARGATVVVPNYDLCPQVTIEDIVRQLIDAVVWTLRHVAAHRGDPARIAVAGHSAGGHLTAMLLSCRWKQVDAELPAQPLTGGLSISGLYDLEPVRLAPYLAGDLRLTPASVRRLSPAFFPRPRVPLMTVVGAEESEEFRRQNRLIRDVWGPTAVPVCEALPGANHFSVLGALVDPASRLHALALRLLGLD